MNPFSTVLGEGRGAPPTPTLTVELAALDTLVAFIALRNFSTSRAHEEALDAVELATPHGGQTQDAGAELERVLDDALTPRRHPPLHEPERLAA